MARRLMIVLVMLCALAGSAVAQAALSVQIGDLTAPHGEDVEIPIRVSGASGVGAMHIEVAYDPAVLSPIREVEAGDLASGAMVVGNTNTPGRVTISLAHPTGFSGDGVVATVRARVAGQDGDSTDLRLENVTAHHAQTKAALATTTSNGSVTTGGGGGVGGSAGVWALVGLLGVVVFGAAAYAFTRRTTRQRAAPLAGPGSMSLRVISGSASPPAFPLTQSVVTIGRAADNNVMVDDEMASRQHARIVSSGDVHTIYDLGSANGTLVNGRPVTQQPIRPGDQITIGSTILIVQ